MNRQQKELVVQLLKENFTQSPASFVVGYKGLTVNEMQSLRKKLRAQGGNLKVTKARLMKIAASDIAGSDALKPYFKEQIGVVFATQEAPAVAKVLYDFAKDHSALQIIVGQFESQVLDAQTIGRIATLPSREQLLAQLCGTLMAPITRLAIVLDMHRAQLAGPAADSKQE